MSNQANETRNGDADAASDEKKMADALKDLFGLMGPKYLNLPADLDGAIVRIRELELALEDLTRCAEIAIASRQFQLLDGFVAAANTALEKKIIEDPNHKPTEVVTVAPGESVNINVGVGKDGTFDAEVRRD